MVAIDDVFLLFEHVSRSYYVCLVLRIDDAMDPCANGSRAVSKTYNRSGHGVTIRERLLGFRARDWYIVRLRAGGLAISLFYLCITKLKLLLIYVLCLRLEKA